MFNLRHVKRSLHEFVDAIETARNDSEFDRVATRLSNCLGFRWFAYLHMVGETPTLISSYPKSWTSRYFDLRYQRIDPVVRRARLAHDVFSWDGDVASPAGTREQREFFDEATTFGIKGGVTVPIRAGFGHTAAFTLATDQRSVSTEHLVGEFGDLFQIVGLYFHMYATVKPRGGARHCGSEIVLSQRERQCLRWVAEGKTVADTAVLIRTSPRTVTFHLGNARRKLNAASIAQAVAEAIRRGLLP